MSKQFSQLAITFGLALILMALMLVRCTATPTTIASTAIAPPTPEPTPTVVVTISLSETTSIEPLNPSALIKVPFVRDGNIYLYQDGEEKLVAQQAPQTSSQACFNLIYPLLSPDGKYLAYVEQIGEQAGEMPGCWVGFLRIVDISTGINKPTNYQISYFGMFRWTRSNLLNFTPEFSYTPQGYTLNNIYLDPASLQETVFETVIDRDESTGAETMLTADFPADDLNRLIRYKDNQYFLVDLTTQTETFLFDHTQAARFLAWSPSGRYAIFERINQPIDGLEGLGLVVDAQNPSGIPQEMIISGDIGGEGDFSTGRKWYFEKGFVEYCREMLFFIDGSPPLQLTNDGGGGCNNEEGFVATSPNGEYAIVKFQDRFELHTKDGDVTVIQEIEPLAKARGIPKNFIWLNDDYLIIFESDHNGYSGPSGKLIVYLFDRQANLIKPLFENAYLIEVMPH